VTYLTKMKLTYLVLLTIVALCCLALGAEAKRDDRVGRKRGNKQRSAIGGGGRRKRGRKQKRRNRNKDDDDDDDDDDDATERKVGRKQKRRNRKNNNLERKNKNGRRKNRKNKNKGEDDDVIERKTKKQKKNRKNKEKQPEVAEPDLPDLNIPDAVEKMDEDKAKITGCVGHDDIIYEVGHLKVEKISGQECHGFYCTDAGIWEYVKLNCMACTYQNVVYQVGAVNYHKDSAPAPCRANRCTLMTPPTATLSGDTVTVTDGTADFVEIGKECEYDMMGMGGVTASS